MSRGEDQVRRRYAHSMEGRSPSEWQPLEEHLHAVAEKAAEFARAFRADDWARLAGLWHDLGKYSDEFQDYLLRENGIEAHLEGKPGKVNHSSAGALWAAEKFPAHGRALAYWILGHHAGLPDFSPEFGGGSCVQDRLKREPPPFRACVPPGIGDQPAPAGAIANVNRALWMRMVFSALVDADFLDTERFMNPAQARLRMVDDSAECWMPRLDRMLSAHLDRLVARAEPSPVNAVRRDVLRRCRERAEAPPQVFTLTVPTGGGKTLSSLAFALRHAVRHRKRRVIYVIPFTSIIEQTASVFRSIPGFRPHVLEHHSNLDLDDPEKTSPRARLAAENWDAPIVVTTAVQFFESLFAARPSACRKLHRIADAVVIFDEAQALPLPVLQPIMSTIQSLARAFGVTPVLCTATQPALGSREGGLRNGLEGLEIMESPAALHQALRRVAPRRHPLWPNPLPWPDLAGELAAHPRVLCIVHRKDDAALLHRLLPEGSFHLSTRMCGAHRAKAVESIAAALKRPDGDVRVVSTQLIEAGVDLDFPVVYRALAGLDSLAQAAGRCNREGRRPAPGDFVVFVPESDPPPSLRTAQDIARAMLAEGGEDMLGLERFTLYFQKYFAARGEDYFDRYGVEPLLAGDRLVFQFAEAAKRFRMIDDEWQRPVIVNYGDAEKLVVDLQRGFEPARLTLRKLQRYIVQVSVRDHDRLRNEGFIEPVSEEFPELCRQLDTGLYREDVGLVLPWKDDYRRGDGAVLA